MKILLFGHVANIFPFGILLLSLLHKLGIVWIFSFFNKLKDFHHSKYRILVFVFHFTGQTSLFC